MTTRRTKAPAGQPDFEALLAGARLPEKTVPTCLRGDLAAEVEALDAELARIQGTPSTSLAGNGSGALLRQIEDLQDQMRLHTYPVRLRALRRTKKAGDLLPSWPELRAQHPPRKDADGEVPLEDLRSGVNMETFQEPLIRASIIDPVLNEAKFADFIAALTDRQFLELFNAAWDLNQGPVLVPFSPAASHARKGSSDG